MSCPADELYRCRRFTVAEYYRMAEIDVPPQTGRFELIDGEVVDMAPPMDRHEVVVTRLQHALEMAVKRSAIVRVQNSIRLSDVSEPQPELALLSWRDDFYAAAHPGPADVLLLIEVADTNLRYDREIKLPLYARHDIGEVWLVDLETDRILRFARPGDAGYQDEQTVDPSRPLTLPGLADLAIDLSGLF